MIKLAITNFSMCHSDNKTLLEHLTETEAQELRYAAIYVQVQYVLTLLFAIYNTF